MEPARRHYTEYDYSRSAALPPNRAGPSMGWGSSSAQDLSIPAVPRLSGPLMPNSITAPVSIHSTAASVTPPPTDLRTSPPGALAAFSIRLAEVSQMTDDTVRRLEANVREPEEDSEGEEEEEEYDDDEDGNRLVIKE